MSAPNARFEHLHNCTKGTPLKNLTLAPSLRVMNSEMQDTPLSPQSVRAFLRALHGFTESQCTPVALGHWQKHLLSEGLWEFGTYVRQLKKLDPLHREAIVDSFSQGQIESKLWLFEILKAVLPHGKYSFKVAGGWTGLTALMGLWLMPQLFKDCESFDIDPRCEEIARFLNEPYSWDGRFAAKTQDIHNASFLPNGPQIFINTICEHIVDFPAWFEQIPQGQFLVLQNNNLLSAKGHVNCVESLQEFEAQAKMDLLFSGELNLFGYKRFMIIGIK